MAKDGRLSCYEKIGFPDSYRKGSEKNIFDDIVSKVHALRGKGKVIADIGPGCSELPHMLIDLCERNQSTLILCDSDEMLSHLPDRHFIEKHPGKFPDSIAAIDRHIGKVDAVIVYSVMQHVFLDMNPFIFTDSAVSLLRDGGGELFLGDIPNITKRKRFFSSKAGIEMHKQFTGRDETPVVRFMELDEGKIDDAIVLSILQRYRNAGCESYVMPQGRHLPLATRREDILIVKH